MTDEVAEALAELAEYFKLDGQRGRAAAYSRAANAVQQAPYIPPDPASIDGVGASVREDIAEFQQCGRMSRLAEMKEKHPYYERFRDIDSVGPVTAQRLGVAGIETKPQLEEAIETGEILDVKGIGEKTAEKIRRNL